MEKSESLRSASTVSYDRMSQVFGDFRLGNSSTQCTIIGLILLVILGLLGYEYTRSRPSSATQFCLPEWKHDMSLFRGVDCSKLDGGSRRAICERVNACRPCSEFGVCAHFKMTCKKDYVFYDGHCLPVADTNQELYKYVKQAQVDYVY